MQSGLPLDARLCAACGSDQKEPEAPLCPICLEDIRRMKKIRELSEAIWDHALAEQHYIDTRGIFQDA